MGALVDHVGDRFGNLLVIERSWPNGGSNGTTAMWRCICDCGNETRSRGADLRFGKARSCGHVRSERLSARDEASLNWQGDEIEYEAAHRRVRASRGPAKTHDCSDCGEPAHDWSYRGGCERERISETHSKGRAFSPDPNMYDPRCKTCHGAYDAQLRRKAREEVAL